MEVEESFWNETSPWSLWTNFTDNSSSPTTEIPYVEYLQRPETYIVPILFALIFIVGVLGNGTLVLIFVRHRNMRNVPNMYIFSLALGDLLVIITCVPFTSTVYTFESWPYGEFICKASECAKDISIGVSVFTLTALSADRFFAIVDPMRKLNTGAGGGGRFRATRCTVLAASSIWMIATICAIPAAVNSYIRVFNISQTKSFKVCYPFRDEVYARFIVTAKFVVYYAVPLLIISFFYLLMARHLILSTRNMPGEEVQGQQARRQVRARKKVAKMVLAFVLVFAVCFFPQHVFMLWFYSDQEHAQENYNAYWHAVRIIGFCLSFINSCINPIALYCVSGTFRKHFNRYLLCACTPDRGIGSNVGRGSVTCAMSKTSGHRFLNTSSRRRSWESTTLAHLQSTVRRTGNVTKAGEDFTVTSLVNGELATKTVAS